MELDLRDAIRLHRLIEIESDGERFLVEPHGLSEVDDGPSLRAFVIEGSRPGWSEFREWSNLNVTRNNFGRREAPAS